MQIVVRYDGGVHPTLVLLVGNDYSFCMDDDREMRPLPDEDDVGQPQMDVEVPPKVDPEEDEGVPIETEDEE